MYLVANKLEMAVTWTIVLTISLSAYVAARLTLVESSTHAAEFQESNGGTLPSDA